MARGLDLKKTRALDLITEVYSEHPLWGAPKVHKVVFARLRDKNDLYYEPYLDDDKWPRENTVYQHLKKIREKDEARSPKSKELDRPWSVVALAYSDISPEALPIVMKAWAKALKDDKPLTIRQVKWVARLYCILGNIDGLIIRALEYANREKAIELTGAYPDKPQNMRGLWFGDAFLYLDFLDKSDKDDVDLGKRLMAMYGIGYEVKRG